MRRKTMAAIAAVAMFTAVGAGAAVAGGNGNGKTWICHGTGSASNPYVLIHVSENSNSFEGNTGWGHRPESHPGHLPDNPDELYDESNDKNAHRQGPIPPADCGTTTTTTIIPE